MRSITFPYLDYKGHKAPLIPVAIKVNKDWKQTTAYVDSGATYSIFKSEEAERMGIKFRSGKENFVVFGDGGFIPIYLHRLTIKIGENEFKAKVAFSSQLGVGFNLLGRKDIFTHFDITFSDRKEAVTFTPL